MLITSLDNDRIKGYIKLKERKYRKKINTFIVEGLHSVLEAYKTGSIIELILEKDEVLPFDLPCVYVTNEIINKISSLETPSNIMALCKINNDNVELGNKILLLDNLQDPGNLGTIIRSAVAFNVDSIVLSPDCVDVYNPKVLRSTQGMIFHLNIIIKKLDEIIPKLKEDGYKIIGTKVTHGKDIKESKTYSHYAIILGNEGTGIKEEILSLCDEYIYIKMNEKCESLNVGVAGSIILYELNNK